MAFWNIANTPVTVIPAGSLAQADYIFQNTGSNTIYISDQQNVTADATSLAIAAGTPFTWSKSDSLYAVCSAGNPSTLFGTANGAQVGTSIAALLTPTAQYVIAAAANTLYRSTYTLTNGIYTIATTPNTVVVNIDFYDVNGALITSVTSTSGSNLTVNLATTAVQFDYWTTSGTNTSISITKSGSNIPFVSGTLYTYTTSQVIPLVGDAYCVLVGGGGGGAGSNNTSAGGGGGGSGALVGSKLYLTGSQSLLVGTGGAGGSTAGNGVAGGASTFAGLTANGGGGGQNGGTGGGSGGTAGAPNGGTGGVGSGGVTGASPAPTVSANTSTIFAFITSGTTGGGGGGGALSQVNSAGAGSGVGIGGAGGAALSNGINGTGIGSGGGGSGGKLAGVGGNGANGGLIIII